MSHIDTDRGNMPTPSLARLQPDSALLALLQVVSSLLLTGLIIACFMISTVAGIAACFALTAAWCIARPGSVPTLLVTAFLFQNMIIAAVTPLVASAEAFDSLRGGNFVILMTAYAIFIAASLQRLRTLAQVRPWLLFGGLLLMVICFYFALGLVRGEPRDAIVYFRNTITPLACFHIALVAASLYRIDIVKALLWLGATAVAYGYSELFFTLDFLSLFNGDQYVKLQMTQQIETGYWEEQLEQTGFVLRGLQDVMTSAFFNTSLFGDLPRVWRLAGPNFHPISYAYALSIISAFLLFRGRWVLPVLTLPILLIIGSKGAMALLLVALAVRIALHFLSPRLTTLLVPVVAAVWIGTAVVVGAGAGDFHVLGFFAGVRDFLGGPLGQGLGIGGNLSSDAAGVDWSMAQATGATLVPMESAVGVILYQMGIGSFVYFAFLMALALLCRRLFLETAQTDFLFGFVLIVMIGANAVLQEEAFYSPLALGLGLLLTGLAIGSYWREQAPSTD